jgi:hypothetical protein
VLDVHQEAACRQLAARDGDRFTGLDWRATPDGAVLIEGASAWFDCSVEQRIRAGDHDIILLRVETDRGGRGRALPDRVGHGQPLPIPGGHDLQSLAANPV